MRPDGHTHLVDGLVAVPQAHRLDIRLDRAERIHRQKDKGRPYPLHVAEVVCRPQRVSRCPFALFGVKAGLAITHRRGLMGGRPDVPANACDGHVLYEHVRSRSDAGRGFI